MVDHSVQERETTKLSWRFARRWGIVAHHKSMVGSHQGEYMGVPASGMQVTTQETGIIRFRDGKMVEFWGTFDDFGIARQLGLIPERE